MSLLVVNTQNEKSRILLDFKTDNINFDNLTIDVSCFEDDVFIINQERVSNFITAYKSSGRLDNNFTIQLDKENKELTPIHLSSSLKQPFQSFRYPLNYLVRPFFLRHSIIPTAQLKDYQSEGVEWLLKSPSRILADDMGLGKTLQSIVASSELIVSGKASTILIVCPPSLITNWAEELKKWAPWFCVYTISNTSNHKNEIWEKLFTYCHFVITNYEQLRDTPPAIEGKILDLIIADEAHKIRKSSSQIHKGIKRLTYKKFWALTGTPIENNANDIKNILSIVNPRVNISNLATDSAITLRTELKSYLLRRMKLDVLSSITDITEINHKIALHPKQLKSYEAEEKKFFTSLNRDRLSNFSKLKEICDFDEVSDQSSKIDYIIELIEKIKARDEKVVIFSFWIKPLEILKIKLKKTYKKGIFSVFAGDLNTKERDDVIKSFKLNDNHFAFLCSGKIGGEGLNLTEANHVIFFNEWWNPSNNSQARDRIIRIGQTKDTFIHHLYTVNTIEESVIKILNTKKLLNSDVIEKMVIKNLRKKN
jgi:SNF2 family DNA or RNA helicase